MDGTMGAPTIVSSSSGGEGVPDNLVVGPIVGLINVGKKVGLGVGFLVGFFVVGVEVGVGVGFVVIGPPVGSLVGLDVGRCVSRNER